ncbi:serine/threonine-protein kinase Nek4 isoform 2-T2 [Anomaloglossus baeobatrachus]|uniref:serine/threonine-protein kinase Nek4 isoform X2 n=1 Tax=Anomaloglossus baeobatrachus TaxID=238106 RepID=UPI003F503F1D
MEENRLRAGLENYTVIRVVGKGSYGEVSLAAHRAEGKQYVIKKLSLRNAPRRERKAAEQEAQLLSQLKHPNIVAYKESWEGDDGLLYIAMGFCEGGDLYHKLKEQKGKLLPESQVVEWFLQITMALQYLHNLHVMHRDLKTQNIFLTKSNIIKVGDLGIARILDSQYDMASTLIGTPYYMSPELFSNQPYNYKSDVWALGCCVYEMATLKHAFNAKDMNSLVYRIIEGKLPPMPKDYSNELRDLIGTMLSRQPEKRPTANQILRKPYIKQHIKLFLDNSKLKQVKRRKKTGDSSHSGVPKNGEQEGRAVTAPGERKRHKVNKGKSPVKTKAASTPPALPDLPHMDNTAASISTLSKVDVSVLPNDKGAASDEHLIPDCRDTPGKVTPKSPKEQDIKGKPPAAFTTNMENNVLPEVTPASMEDEEDTMRLLQPACKGGSHTNQESLDSTEKLLQPFVPVTEPDGVAAVAEIHEIQPHNSISEPSLSRQRRQKTREDLSSHSEQNPAVCPRPLPSPPAIPERPATKSLSSPERTASAAKPGGGSKPSTQLSQDHRPLSARERRRLKQSQEEISIPAPSVKAHSAQAFDRGQAMNPVCQSLPSLHGERRHSSHGLYVESDLSSSTNSTDKSDGDYRERKDSDSGEMNDLVNLMTETLHMEKDNVQMPPAAFKEFRLNKRYRDTLMLHGRKSEEQEEISLEDLAPDLTVQDKFRRGIEVMRTEVVQGLGVKVLEEVYNIMDEEDDDLKESHLQELLGEKYGKYILKLYQLKFLEENSKF